MLGVLVPLAVVGFIAGSHGQAVQTTVNVTTFPYYESLTVCAPINVLITTAKDGKYSLTVDADPDVQKALLISYSGGKGLGIETSGDFQTSNPIKIILSLPPQTMQYIELDYSNSDLAVDNSFSNEKGEIANNGNGNVIITKGLDGDLAKISTVGSGNVIVRGAAPYMELFSAGSGNRYLTGFKRQINVKQDGSGFVGINPSTGAATIGGVNTGSGPVSYAQGNCTVRRDPDAGPPKVGDACAKVSSVSVPQQTLYWTCGIAVKGEYNCGGTGFAGPPSFSKIPCSTAQNSLVMIDTAQYF